MGLLIYALIVVVILALALYLIGLLPLQRPIPLILQGLVVLIAIVALAQRAGLM